MMMGAGGAGTRLRPLALSDVLDETFRIYRRQFKAMVMVMGVMAVPLAILSIAVIAVGGTLGMQALTSGGPNGPSVTAILATISTVIPLVILNTLARLVAGAAAVRVASDAILGLPTDVGGAYREAFRRLGTILGGNFLAGLAATLLAMTCIGIPFAIYIGLGWALVLPLIMIEGLGMSAAMGRSWGLVKGHRWRLLVALVLIGLIMYLLVSIPSGIFGFVGGIANAILQAGTTGVLVVQAGNAVFGALGETLFGAIAYIAITLFYYDLRIRKEAFDLQQRAQYADLSAGAGTPGAPTYPAQTGYADQPPYPGQEGPAAPPSPPRPIIPPPPMASPDQQ
jgi:hypothetical protein